MRKPEEIKAEIEKLEEELSKSKLFHSKTLLVDNKWSDDMIGFYDMEKGRKILTALHEGKVLLLEHQAIGDFKVYMNPQRNRISVVYADTGLRVDRECLIQESTILEFIFNNPTTWYTLNLENN